MIEDEIYTLKLTRSELEVMELFLGDAILSLEDTDFDESGQKQLQNLKSIVDKILPMFGA